MMLLSEIQRKGLPIQDLVEELRDLQTLLTLFGQQIAEKVSEDAQP